ncbi:hypothetical protein [Rhodococcus koreensis]
MTDHIEIYLENVDPELWELYTGQPADQAKQDASGAPNRDTGDPGD